MAVGYSNLVRSIQSRSDRNWAGEWESYLTRTGVGQSTLRNCPITHTRDNAHINRRRQNRCSERRQWGEIGCATCLVRFFCFVVACADGVLAVDAFWVSFRVQKLSVCFFFWVAWAGTAAVGLLWPPYAWGCCSGRCRGQ